MNLPTDPWAKIGQAEELIRQVVCRPTEWPKDMTANEIENLEGIMEKLESMLRVSA